MIGFASDVKSSLGLAIINIIAQNATKRFKEIKQ